MQDTRSIRLSQEDWNALLLVAVQNGYPNRTEYIRATISNPLTRIVPESAIPTMTPEVEMELRREISMHKAEIAKLRDTAQPTPITENPQSTKKPVHRFPFASILKHWPEARRNRYNKLPSMPTEWVNFTLETAYDMLDELE